MIPEACNLPVVSKPESRFSEGLVLRLRLVWNWDETIFPRDKCLLLISLHFERAVSVMRVRKREACSESCGNNLITHALTHHARSKRSEINSNFFSPPGAGPRRSFRPGLDCDCCQASSGNHGSSNGGNDGSSGNDGSGGIMTVAMTIFRSL